jgi:hypothetical protein
MRMKHVVVVMELVTVVACRPKVGTSPDGDRQRLRRIAQELFQLDPGKIEREGSERNMAGVRSDRVLFSRRLDSRTYFMQDLVYQGVVDAPFAASERELVRTTRSIAARLDVPAAEISGESVMTEQLQTARLDASTHRATPGQVSQGKRYVQLRRSVEGVPVFSSRALLAFAGDRHITFMELHWPEISEADVRQARRLQSAVRSGWRPPEQRAATVESVEAGIIHSPAIGFVMDVRPAIRVIYAPADSRVGRKLTLYLDEQGRPVPMPRQFEKIDETPNPAPRVAKPGRR